MARISRATALGAASKLVEPLEKQIEAAHAALRSYVHTEAKKHVPKEVLALVPKYSKHLDMRLQVCFRSGKEYTYYSFPKDMELPIGSITVTKAVYAKAKKMENAINEANRTWRDKRKEIYTALLALGTQKKIAEHFPEAQPFLNFPNQAPSKTPEKAPDVSAARATVKALSTLAKPTIRKPTKRAVVSKKSK